MSDPSPSGETWVCRAAKGYTRCDVLPCTVRGYPEHKRCGPVPHSGLHGFWNQRMQWFAARPTDGRSIHGACE